MELRACRQGLARYITLFPLLDDEAFLLLLIANNCGATIEREKVSSLFAIRNTSKRRLFDIWRKKKDEILSFFGLKSITLHRSNESCIVLFYYEDVINAHLRKEENFSFLKGMGYDEDSLLSELRNRFRLGCPHEIGVFLGYPVHDVRDFMYYPEKKVLRVGYWKVYSRLEEAEKTFLIYDEAKHRSVNRTVKAIVESKKMPYELLTLSTA